MDLSSRKRRDPTCTTPWVPARRTRGLDRDPWSPVSTMSRMGWVRGRELGNRGTGGRREVRVLGKVRGLGPCDGPAPSREGGPKRAEAGVWCKPTRGGTRLGRWVRALGVDRTRDTAVRPGRPARPVDGPTTHPPSAPTRSPRTTRTPLGEGTSKTRGVKTHRTRPSVTQTPPLCPYLLLSWTSGPLPPSLGRPPLR